MWLSQLVAGGQANDGAKPLPDELDRSRRVNSSVGRSRVLRTK